jgi:hypothetical protein
MVKLQVLGNNSKTVNNIKNLIWGKNDQHIKIYLPCNFEVNLITHFGVIALFSSIFFLQDGTDGHNFERGPPKDHFSKVWLRLAQ